MAKGKTTVAAAEPIMDNEHVKELLAILKENNAPSAKDYLSVLKQVTAMEKQLEAAVTELVSMRQDLKTAQEQNHPVKNTLQKAVIAMQGQVLELRDKLAKLKQSVIYGCKNAVAAFREKGISALDNVARFFKIRPILEAMRGELDKSIASDDKAISKIEAISEEYHQAGRHLKNIGRAMLGKEAIQEAKPPGKLTKTILAPYRAERSCFCAMKKSVEAAISNFTRLEDRAKPSIKKTIQKHSEQTAQDKKEATAPERPRPTHAER